MLVDLSVQIFKIFENNNLVKTYTGSMITEMRDFFINNSMNIGDNAHA